MPRRKRRGGVGQPAGARTPRSWLVALGMIAGLGVCLIFVATCHHNRGATEITPIPSVSIGSGERSAEPEASGDAPSIATSQPVPDAPAAPEPPAADAKMIVHLIDVGQGAATLVEFSCAAILIDTGGEENDRFDSSKHLIKYLDAFFKRRSDLHETLALLLLTHPHIDHTRNAMAVWKRFHVTNLVTDGLTNSSGGKQQRAVIEAADAAHIGEDKINEHAIPVGGLRDQIIDPVACPDGDPDIRVLWGDVTATDVDWGEAVFKNANEDSVVTKISLGNSSLLVLGDLQNHGIDALLKRNAGSDVLHADVLEVGHHGSNNGTTKALLNAIAPKLALISVGSAERREMWTAWQYGHPRQSTIELLEASLSGDHRAPIEEQLATGGKKFLKKRVNAPIYATAWDGNIQVTMFFDGRHEVKVHVNP